MKLMVYGENYCKTIIILKTNNYYSAKPIIRSDNFPSINLLFKGFIVFKLIEPTNTNASLYPEVAILISSVRVQYGTTESVIDLSAFAIFMIPFSITQVLLIIEFQTRITITYQVGV
jgi:hypothetical protein